MTNNSKSKHKRQFIYTKGQFVYTLFLITLLSSCSYFRHKHNEGIAAEVAGKTLSFSQLDGITAGLDSIDSISVADAYIKQWATDALIYDEAVKQKSSELDEMVEAYRRNLYLQEYEQRLVAQNIQHHIPDSVIEEFYNAHTDRFILNETILKGILLVYPIGTPKQDKLKKWLQSPDEEDLENIEKYMYQYGKGYELFLSEWRTANQVIIRLPIETDNLQQQLRRQSLIETQDSTSVYLLQVTDKRFTGDIMPLELAKDEIGRLLMTQKQTDILHAEREKTYQEAVRHNKIKIYHR